MDWLLLRLRHSPAFPIASSVVSLSLTAPPTTEVIGAAPETTLSASPGPAHAAKSAAPTGASRASPRLASPPPSPALLSSCFLTLLPPPSRPLKAARQEESYSERGEGRGRGGLAGARARGGARSLTEAQSGGPTDGRTDRAAVGMGRGGRRGRVGSEVSLPKVGPG